MLPYLPVVYFCLFLQFIHVIFVYLLCPCDFGCDGEGLPTWWLSRANEQSKLLSAHSQQYKFNPNYLVFSKKTPSIVLRVCLFICLDNVYSENMLYEVFWRPLLTLPQLSISFDSSVITFSGLVNSRTRPSRNPYKNFQLYLSSKYLCAFRRIDEHPWLPPCPRKSQGHCKTRLINHF